MYLFWIILGIVYVIYRICKDEGIGDTSQPYLTRKDTVTQAQERFERYGYGKISQDVIKTILYSQARIPLKRAYDQLCHIESLKLKSKTLKEIDNLVGFSVCAKIPEDTEAQPPYNSTKRYALVREYILMRDTGLKFNNTGSYGVYTNDSMKDAYSTDVREILPIIDKYKKIMPNFD